MILQKNILIINYAFLLYFNKYDENVKIDLNNRVDRKKLVSTVFKHSNIDWEDTWNYINEFMDSFYKLQEDKLESDSISREISKLFGYCILNWNLNEINPNLAKTVLSLKENFDDISTYEVCERFDDAFNILIDIFGDDFPRYDEKLISDSILDKKKGYYYRVLDF